MTAISREQLAELLPAAVLDEGVVSSLRRLADPRGVHTHDLRHGQLMFDLLVAFARQPDIDRGVVGRIRGEWIRRVVAATSRLRPVPARHLAAFVGRALWVQPTALTPRRKPFARCRAARGEPSAWPESEA